MKKLIVISTLICVFALFLCFGVGAADYPSVSSVVPSGRDYIIWKLNDDGRVFLWFGVSPSDTILRDSSTKLSLNGNFKRYVLVNGAWSYYGADIVGSSLYGVSHTLLYFSGDNDFKDVASYSDDSMSLGWVINKDWQRARSPFDTSVSPQYKTQIVVYSPFDGVFYEITTDGKVEVSYDTAKKTYGYKLVGFTYFQSRVFLCDGRNLVSGSYPTENYKVLQNYDGYIVQPLGDWITVWLKYSDTFYNTLDFYVPDINVSGTPYILSPLSGSYKFNVPSGSTYSLPFWGVPVFLNQRIAPTGYSDASFKFAGTTAYYSGDYASRNIALVNGKTIPAPDGSFTSLPVSVANKFLKHFGMPEVSKNDTGAEIAQGISDLNDTVAAGADAISSINTNISQVAADLGKYNGFQTIFLGVWGALPPWVIFCIVFAILMSLARKVVGQ